VSFAEEDGIGAVDYEDSREWKPPADFGGIVVAEASVVERNVDEDGLIVTAEVLRDGVGDAELLGQGGTGVGEQRVGEAVLFEREVVLTRGLGGDGDEKCAIFAETSVEVAPGFEFGNAIGVPSAAEEVDDERAEGEEVGGVDGLMSEGVFKREDRSLRSGLQDPVLDTGVEEIFSRFFRDGETFRLYEGTGILRDAVKLILEQDVESGSHTYIIAAVSLVLLVALSSWQATPDSDFFAIILLWLELVATGAAFISLMRVTRRVKPCSRAVLLPGTVLSGSSPARMNPWPAPS